MTIKVIQNQSLYDLAVQEYGTVEAVFDLAFANQLNVSDELIPGQELVLPESEHKFQEVVDYFKGKNTLIATVTPEDMIIDYELPGGELPMSL